MSARNRLNSLSLAAVFALALLGSVSPAAAQKVFPDRSVTLVLPYAPGGTVDIQARLLAQGLTGKLGHAVIVRNMPGATGAIATDFVARAPGDGYTLLFASSAQITSVPMTQKVNYKLQDLTPVSASGRGTMVLAINAKLPAKHLKEFIEYARANPGKISYGSSGTGSVGHLVGALFGARAGLDMVHIPYKGGGAVMADLLAGHLQMIFGNSGEVMAQAKNENIRVLAVSSTARMKQLPNTPAIAEILPGFEMTAWQGTLAPAATPRYIIDILAKAIMDLSREPGVIDKLEQSGVLSTTTSPEQMAAIIKEEQSAYAEAVKAAGLSKPD